MIIRNKGQWKTIQTLDLNTLQEQEYIFGKDCHTTLGIDFIPSIFRILENSKLFNKTKVLVASDFIQNGLEHRKCFCFFSTRQDASNCHCCNLLRPIIVLVSAVSLWNHFMHTMLIAWGITRIINVGIDLQVPFHFEWYQVKHQEWDKRKIRECAPRMDNRRHFFLLLASC